jgi:hypothetical protein
MHEKTRKVAEKSIILSATSRFLTAFRRGLFPGFAARREEALDARRKISNPTKRFP